MTNEKQQLIFQVYDPEGQVKEALTALQKQQKLINKAMVGVVVVVALGFSAIVIAAFTVFIDHQDYAAEKYSEYIKLIEQKENS